MLQTLGMDLRAGWRSLLKSPGLTLVVILTLALAIGANTVIFSFTNVLLLKPLPIAESERVGHVFGTDPQRGDERARLSYPDYIDLRDRNRSFQTLGAFGPDNYVLTDEREPQRLAALRTTANFFEVWGLQTILGRGFRPDEDRLGAPGTVVLSHRFWNKHFHSNPEVLGSSMILNGAPHAVVGVLAPDIEIGTLSLIDIWTPLAQDPAQADRSRRFLRVTGKLDPGVLIEQASAEITALGRQLVKEHPDTHTGWSLRVLPTREAITGPNTWLVLALLGLSVGFLLLIACANIANLILARSVSRRRELAVRRALGASRAQILGQLIQENLVLGVIGGAAGLGLAALGLWLIRAVAYEPFFEMVVIDRSVLVFSAAISLLAPFIFSILPALQSAREELSAALNEGSSRTSGGLRGRRSRSVLVVSQIALALTLLVISGLAVRTAIAVQQTDLGFEPKNVLTARIDLPESKYAEAESVRRFYRELLPRLAALPGVTHAAAISEIPVLGTETTTQLTIAGRPAPLPSDRPWAVRLVTSPDYLQSVDLSLLQGRGFSAADAAATQPVALISREMARRYWKQEAAALGQRIALEDQPDRWIEIVGIVGDIQSQDFQIRTRPTLYLPLEQSVAHSMALMVRIEREPAGIVGPLRREVRRVDPLQAVYDIKTMDQLFTEVLRSDTVLIGMFAAFAIIALLMACSGLYAVMSYAVSQRVQEIGIRMALGARMGNILRLFVGQGLKFTAIGALIGLGGGLLLARAMTKLLYGVGPTDPLTYVLVLALLTGVAVLASFVPALRAARLDPARTLRQQ